MLLTITMIVIPIVFVSLFISYYHNFEYNVVMSMMSLSIIVMIAVNILTWQFVIIPFLMMATILWNMLFRGG